ncbi:MAG TPA: hypothetical protein DD401_07060 [Prevotella sp.]|nr:hypothetical protein [Prevotella sp.]
MIDEYEQQQRRFAQRRAAQQRLTADVRRLVDQPPRSVVWHRTKTDLVEMIHLAWLTHEIHDEYGRPRSQQDLARRAFRAVGLEMPRHLTHWVWKINNRVSDHRSVLRTYLQDEDL